MFKKMLHHTLLSAVVVGIFAGGYALTFGSDLSFSDHHHSREG